MSAASRAPDFVAIGHLTIDRTSGGEMLGGTVLYAAVAAARLGARAAILTRANFDELSAEQRETLTRITTEVEIVGQAGSSTTTFTNREVGDRREQTLHAWGGEIDLNGLPAHWRSARVIHLAPVAQEIDLRQTGRLSPRLLGCTPQGWMRDWHPQRLGQVRLVAPRIPREVLAHIDALVLSSAEFVLAREVVEAVGARGVAAVTRGAQGATAIDRGREIDVPTFRVPVVDPVGAGDVFAGVLFASRALGQSVAASLRFAAAAAALKVAGHGVDAVPGREAIAQLIEDGRFRGTRNEERGASRG